MDEELKNTNSKEAELIEKDEYLKARELKARRRAREKGSFLAHFFLFIFANIGLFLSDLIWKWDDGRMPWINYGWLIGLAIHFLGVYLFDGIVASYVDSETENEMEKVRKEMDK